MITYSQLEALFKKSSNTNQPIEILLDGGWIEVLTEQGIAPHLKHRVRPIPQPPKEWYIHPNEKPVPVQYNDFSERLYGAAPGWSIVREVV